MLRLFVLPRNTPHLALPDFSVHVGNPPPTRGVDEIHIRTPIGETMSDLVNQHERAWYWMQIKTALKPGGRVFGREPEYSAGERRKR